MELRIIAQRLHEAIVEAGEHALQVQISPRTFSTKESLQSGADQGSQLITASVDEDILTFMRHKVDSIGPFDGYW